MSKEYPKLSDIKKVLMYEEHSGKFYWVVDTYKLTPCKKEAGTISGYGYIVISFNNKLYLAHRLAWYYINGEPPKKSIDHIDGVRTNNRISNLREVTPRENSGNQKKHRKGGLVGSTYVSKFNKWYSQIVVNKKNIYLGSYDTELEAHEAYLKYKKENNLK
jgi:hypothetical protein